MRTVVLSTEYADALPAADSLPPLARTTNVRDHMSARFDHDRRYIDWIRGGA